MQCYLTKELAIIIQHIQYNIDVAVGLRTDDFILGLDVLLKHQCIVDIDVIVLITLMPMHYHESQRNMKHAIVMKLGMR